MMVDKEAHEKAIRKDECYNRCIILSKFIKVQLEDWGDGSVALQAWGPAGFDPRNSH